MNGQRAHCPELIAKLQAIQDEHRYLPAVELQKLAAECGVSEAEVTGVATFYAQFRFTPAGVHTIRVCDGTACHVKGAEQTFEAFRRALNLAEGESTDNDGLFTVEKVACLGCCMLAVAVQVDDVIYGHVTPHTVQHVLADVLAGDLPGGASGINAKSVSAGEVRMCTCSSCAASGALETAAAVKRVLAAQNLPVRFVEVGCHGLSFDAPVMDVAFADGRYFRYGKVSAPDVEPILLKLFAPKGISPVVRSAVKGLLLRLFADVPPGSGLTRYPADNRDHPGVRYEACQCRIVTEGGGVQTITQRDAAVAKLPEPEALICLIEESGLRGRGGGGFSTGAKWRAVRGAQGARKVVVCNGDEGDPGAFMDRMILESFPLRVLEGMLFAAQAVGAQECLLYIRHEYPVALRRIEAALEQLGLSGASAEDSGLPLFRIVEGAGAFVCGEETALLASLEGRRGVPQLRPPFPAESGFEGVPTLVNNVETFAAVSWIVRHGAEAFRAVGTARSPGTKTFALAGKIPFGGLVEVPMGTSLNAIVRELGGAADTVKAVQVGGPSGGCVPLAELGDTPVDYEALGAVGAMVGSGGLVALGNDDCMVDIARYFLAFTQAESCGKCTMCRIGVRRMLELLERLCEGRGTLQDIDALEKLALDVRQGSLCGLGRTAPNPVLSTLRHFRAEYEAHVRRECPARRCRALIEYSVTADCIGCTLCAQSCPEEAISFVPFERAEIDVSRCTQCDVCAQVCPQRAIVRISPRRTASAS